MDKAAPVFVDRETIRLSKNGTWLSDGVEITHEVTRRAFAKNLKKDKEGYFISIGRETKRIIVEDTAYFVLSLEGSPTQGYVLRMNDETSEALIPETLKYTPGRLTCLVKEKNEEARFLHPAYFDLLSQLQEDESQYYLNISTPAALQPKRIILASKSK
jgi:hypothetical protein